MKALLLALLLASCRAKEVPVLFNRVDPPWREIDPKYGDWCWNLDHSWKMVCAKFVTPNFGIIRCGCCSRIYSNWECMNQL